MCECVCVCVGGVGVGGYILNILNKDKIPRATPPPWRSGYRLLLISMNLELGQGSNLRESKTYLSHIMFKGR